MTVAAAPVVFYFTLNFPLFFFNLLAVKKGKVSKQSERAECADAKWSEHSGQV